MEPILQAHKHSIHNREELEQSELCGCFYCLATFAPSKIKSWTDEDTTALCPKCGIDSVLGSASEFPIDKAFLSAMKLYWF